MTLGAQSLNDEKRIGLALAGGGPEGAVYEIGALRALDEALEGVAFDGLDIYVGVSAGAFVCACLANGLTPTDMARAVVTHLPYGHPILPHTFLTPAIWEFMRRGMRVPLLLTRALWDYVLRAEDHTFTEAMSHLAVVLPIALFDNEPIREYLHTIYTQNGRSDDFRQLTRVLRVVATDLDSAQAVLFGDEGFDDVPISRAVQASSALPGLYPPVCIDGRYYVDGVLLKTLHASVALEKGAGLVICVNPIVPFDTAQAASQGLPKGAPLVDQGLPIVLTQALRTIIHSRMSVGMAAYDERFPDRDVVLFEPHRDDTRMFFTNIFGFAARKAICEHAYAATRRDLLQRYDQLSPIFARHGIRIRREMLEDTSRNLWVGIGLTAGGTAPPVTETLDQLLTRLQSLVDRDAASRAEAAAPLSAGADVP